MARKYERKTDRANTPPDVMLKAVRAVKIHNVSIRQASLKFNISYRTLSRYCKKIPEKDYVCEDTTTPTVSVGYTTVRRIFTNSQEQELINYILRASDIYFDLSPKEIKILAYNLARSNSIKIPASWIKNKMAGDDWFNALMKRHSDLPIRKPKVASKAGTTNFNRTNIELFYNSLEKVMSCYNFQPEDIWNIDEIGITTTHVPDRIVARKDHKQVRSDVTTGCENLVTMACTMSAIGNHMPPFFVFPFVHFTNDSLAFILPGASSTANRSGWMQEKDFEQFLKHFQAHAKCSIEKPVLLLLDKYSSRLSIGSLNYAKENGIVMLSFPPHCSHKLQPLNRTVFEHFRKHVNSASNTWVLNNPNCTMNIYNILEIVAVVYPSAMTPTNIQESFKCTGIFPYNKDILSDLDFVPSFIATTSLPEENKNNDEQQAMIGHFIDIEATNFSECHASQSLPEKSNEVFDILSPEDLQTFSKTDLQITCKYARKQATAIPIDTSTQRKLKLEDIENKNTNKRKYVKEQLKENKEGKTEGDNSAKKSKEIKQIAKYKKIEEKEKKSKVSIEEKCFCSVCLKSYPNSLSKQKWVHCIHCKEWSHETCISNIIYYTCHNCEST